ncbi:hypothetical protein K1719_045874 [Acacia pycnantha]|nr:hypothetical protein K1719_045874 [Acacia pycnantha]
MIYYTTWLIYRVDPLKYIFESSHVAGRVSKCQIILSEYDIRYVTKKSIKGGTKDDHLAENPIVEYQLLDFKFPDEDICATKDPNEESKLKEWEMYFDGATNMHGICVGALIIFQDRKQCPIAIKVGFDCTNNVAE